MLFVTLAAMDGEAEGELVGGIVSLSESEGREDFNDSPLKVLKIYPPTLNVFDTRPWNPLR